MTEVSTSRMVHRTGWLARRCGIERLALTVALGLGLATALAGCTSTLSDMPTQLGGLPAGTPERSNAPAAYPAVHDMPPPRQDVVLTAEQQKKAAAELAALRARQEKQAATTPKKVPTDQ